MLDEDSGWALTEGRLVLTTDAGRTWRDLTPIDIFAPELRAAHFIDAAHGWLVGESPRGTLRVYTLRDSEWSVSRTEISGSAASISFADPQHGWLAVREGSAMFRSDDGGATWDAVGSATRMPRSVAAVSGTRALVGDDIGDLSVFRQDGIDSRVQLPDAEGASFPVRSEDGWWMIRLESGRVTVLRSDDGVTWRKASTLRSDLTVATGTIPVARAPGVLFTASSGKVAQIQPCCQTLRSDGLSSPVHSLSFANARVGWAVAGEPAFLYATDDGGNSWRKLVP